MLIEHVNISGRDLAPPSQARAPTTNNTPCKLKGTRMGEKALELSHLSEKIANLQKNLSMTHDVDVQFKVHKPTGEVMVTVSDESTGKIIREIPPAEVLNLAAKIDAMVGLIFDQKV